MSYKPINSLDDIESLEGGETADFVPASKGNYMTRGLVLTRNGDGHSRNAIRFIGYVTREEEDETLSVIQVNRSDLTPEKGKLQIRDRATIVGPIVPSNADIIRYSTHFIE